MIIVIFFSLIACEKVEEKIIEDEIVEQENEVEDKTVEKHYNIEVLEKGELIFDSTNDYYRYSPSLLKYEDGSMDIWLSSPGNSSSQWDYISYRHCDSEGNWSKEEIVLKPTVGSKDRCSVCDPGVIYFDGYYYLAYTATDYYEGNGSYNMAFVARSRNADGPFEKWNGSSWGGDPEPIIFYDGGKDNWGIGEVSFVIKDEDLFIYYSYIDVLDNYIGLCKADLCEDWPLTIRNKGKVLYQNNHDSVDFVYDCYLDLFLAFSIGDRMSENSYLQVYVSENGKDFREACSTKTMICDYAHNVGIAKDECGWVDSSKDLLIAYAFGKNWGRWSTLLQPACFFEE